MGSEKKGDEEQSVRVIVSLLFAGEVMPFVVSDVIVCSVPGVGMDSMGVFFQGKRPKVAR